jgi:hypothetical protein
MCLRAFVEFGSQKLNFYRTRPDVFARVISVNHVLLGEQNVARINFNESYVDRVDLGE